MRDTKSCSVTLNRLQSDTIFNAMACSMASNSAHVRPAWVIEMIIAAISVASDINIKTFELDAWAKECSSWQKALVALNATKYCQVSSLRNTHHVTWKAVFRSYAVRNPHISETAGFLSQQEVLLLSLAFSPCLCRLLTYTCTTPSFPGNYWIRGQFT